LDCAQFEDASMQELRRESAIMSTSRHRNIVSEYISFMSANYLWIVMQLIDAGSCTDIMTMLRAQSGQAGIRDEAIIATIMRETMHGLRYLHSNGKIHRDVKAGNILLNLEGEVLCADFGVSAQMKKGQKNNTVCGSPCWMAPEVMNTKGHDTSADIWSLGITAIELALGDAPLSQYPHMKVIRLILEQSPPELPTNGWSDEFKSFVNACLKKEPSERPDIDRLLVQQAAFLDKARDMDYIRDNFLISLPPLEQRLRPELAAIGDEFLQRISIASHKPKKKQMKFDFGSGEDRRGDTKPATEVAGPSKTVHESMTNQIPHPAAIEDDGLFDDMDEDEGL
jgi:serine/threonine protein kinase